jgi:hypothetical protein
MLAALGRGRCGHAVDGGEVCGQPMARARAAGSDGGKVRAVGGRLGHNNGGKVRAVGGGLGCDNGGEVQAQARRRRRAKIRQLPASSELLALGP